MYGNFWTILKIYFLTISQFSVYSGTEVVNDWSNFSFSSEPSDVIVRKNSPVWLQCGVHGVSNPSITWRKDETPLHLVQDSQRHLFPNGTLLIRSVKTSRSESDSGNYRCVVVDPSIGTIISTGAKVTVAGLPQFSKQPNDMTIFEGDRARFSCSIESLPPAKIIWHRDGHQLRLDSRMTLLPSGSLEIESVKMADRGDYYCHAVSFDKTKVSSKARLTVKEALALRPPTPPHFVAEPSNYVGRVGDNVTLDCAANGYPHPSVVWLKDGSTIDTQNLDSRFIYVGPTRSLLINDLQALDEGIYTCRAENKIDSVNTIAHVQVQVIPSIISRPGNTLAYENEDVQLNCKVYGKPKPLVVWYKNGEVIKENEYFKIIKSSNLKILGLVPADSGMYQCFASNAAGEAQASAQLLVLRSDLKPADTLMDDPKASFNRGKLKKTSNSLPSAPKHFHNIITSSRYITLSWHIPDINDNIVAYSVYYRQKDSHRERIQNISVTDSVDGDVFKTQIGHLTPGATYYLRVAAITPQGEGKSSKEIEVVTTPDLDVPDAPYGVTVTPKSPKSLFVTWYSPSMITPVTDYILYYMKAGSADERDVSAFTTSYLLTGLEEYTEYSVWVHARNHNGKGSPTHQVTGRTYSDVPSGTPQTVSLKPASSSSLILRWEPPTPKDQNGIITGYKIKYRQKRESNSLTKTTDGNRRLYALTDLDKDTQYSVKMTALTVNGSGPYTNWIHGKTYSSDLNEDSVPDKLSASRAEADRTSIELHWRPPFSKNIKIRGYAISWGIGIPDVYRKEIKDEHQLSYTIKDLEPNSEYIITLRAFNRKGDGLPLFEQVRTLAKEKTSKPSLGPPVGLRTEVLTPFAIEVSWTDAIQRRNQFGNDVDYTVRYTTYAQSSSSKPKHKYVNVSDISVVVDNLKAATAYEFSVKTVQGKRESPWSLIVMNTTMEARPSSPPRDVTVVTMVDNPTKVVFNWQPPKHANGQITGYLIFYSTNPENDWAMEEIDGSKMTSTIRGLTASTLYFYKMQAENIKGLGPFSTMANFTTLSGMSHSKAPPPDDLFQNTGLTAIIIGIIVGVVCFVAALAAFLLLCRKSHVKSRVTNGNGTLTKQSKVEIKPPDLWIHHEHLELKSIEKDHRNSSPSHVAVTGDNLSDDETDRLLNRQSFRPKPLIISLDVTKDSIIGGSTSSSVYSDGTLGRPNYTLPHYPTTQSYSSPENPYSANNPTNILAGSSTIGSSCLSHDPINPLSHPPSQAFKLISPTGCGGTFNCDSGSNTLGKRLNPLRSFSVPSPAQSAPTTPAPKHMGCTRSQGQTSPFKKALNIPPSSLASNLPSSARRVLPMGNVESLPEQEEANERLIRGSSTEELTQEMACLEGLMKDLSVIQANQFNC